MKKTFLPLPNWELLNSRFRYDQDSGKLLYRVSVGRARIYTEAGNRDVHGYIRIRIKNRLLYAHRIAYFLMTKIDPLSQQVDHIDLNRSNNRWNNLRLVTQDENMWNTLKPSTNTSGVKGVYWHRQNQSWHGEIKKGGKKYSTGPCPTKEKAEELLKEMRSNLHQSFANNG